MMKFSCINLVFFFSGLFSLSCLAGNLIEDPVLDFINYEKVTGGLLKEHEILELRVDINDDGFNDVLVSSTARDRRSGRVNGIWDVYLSDQKGNYFVLKTVQKYYEGRADIIASGGSFLAYVNEIGRNALISYAPGGAIEGTYFADYVNEKNELNTIVLARVNDSMEFWGNNFLEKKNIISNIQYIASSKRFNLNEILSPEELSSIKSKKDDFWSNHYSAVNPDDPLKRRVINKHTGELVGYQIMFGEVIPIKKSTNEKSNKVSEPTEDKTEPEQRKRPEATDLSPTSNEKKSSDADSSMEKSEQDEDSKEEFYLLYFVIVGLILIAGLILFYKKKYNGRNIR